jgi:predicted site-specific integrase-resolvase
MPAKAGKVAMLKFAPDVERQFVSVAEAEALTGISRWTWRVYAYKGRVASVKVGRRLLLPLSELHRILAEGTRPRVETQ